MAVGFLFAGCQKDKPEIFPGQGFYGNISFYKHDLNSTALRFSDFGVTVDNNLTTDLFRLDNNGKEILSYNEDELLNGGRVLEEDNFHIKIELNVDTIGYDREVNGKKAHETLRPIALKPTTATLNWNTVANGTGLTRAEKLNYLKSAFHSLNGKPQTLIPRPSPFN